jgi:hypothetical protein
VAQDDRVVPPGHDAVDGGHALGLEEEEAGEDEGQGRERGVGQQEVAAGVWCVVGEDGVGEEALLPAERELLEEAAARRVEFLFVGMR